MSVKRGILILSQGKTGSQSLHRFAYENSPLDFHILNSHELSVMVDDSGKRIKEQNGNIICPDYRTFEKIGISGSKELINSFDNIKIITVLRDPYDAVISDFLESIKIEAAALHVCSYYGDTDYSYSEDLLSKESIIDLIEVPRFRSWALSKEIEPHSSPGSLSEILTKISENNNTLNKELIGRWIVDSFINYEKFNDIFVNCTVPTVLEAFIHNYKETLGLSDDDFKMKNSKFKIIRKNNVECLILKYSHLKNLTNVICDFLNIPFIEIPKVNVTSTSDYKKWYGISHLEIKKLITDGAVPSIAFNTKSIFEKIGKL